MTVKYLSAEQFAELACISRQAAWKALKSGCWRGENLVVRTVKGRGGRSGTSYRVKLSSLPRELQQAFNRDLSQLEMDLPLPSPGEDAAETTWWLHHLDPILVHPENSTERGEALAALIGTVQLDWNGQKREMARSTIYRKIHELEGKGSMAGLRRRRRADTGKPRVILSKAWDAAVPFDKATKRRIAEATQQEMRSLIAGGSARKIALVLTREYLKGQTSEHGWRPNDPAEFNRVCKIPLSLYQDNIHYKKVHRHKTDRKASFDNAPLIKRHIADTFPSSTIVADVHHCNVLVQRQDGSTATPKFIAFFDVATHRVWVETVFFEGRGGVRNIDMIEAFVAMAMDAAWGLPKIFYCDNGTENLFAGFLDDALKLAATDLSTNISRTGTVNALPYRGRSKPIERWFGQFEQQFLSTCQGYIGDDRMNPKQPQLGKMPAAFPGGIDAFNSRVQRFLGAYHGLPQSGQLRGMTPNEALEGFIDQGWRATVMNPENLLTVFTKPETRQLRNHAFKMDGRDWSCIELARFHGDTVVVRKPQLGLGFNELRVEAPNGELIGIATPSEEYSYHDPRGAKKSAELSKTMHAGLRQLRQSAPPRDVGAALLRFADDQMPVVPNDPKGTVRAGNAGDTNVIMPSHQPKTSRQQEQEERRKMLELQSTRFEPRKNSA